MEFLETLEQIIAQRKQQGSEGSYVASLFKKGTAKISQKVGEEAVELVIEAMSKDDERFRNEAADLLFHYLILLQDRGLMLQDVLEVLQERHRQG